MPGRLDLGTASARDGSLTGGVGWDLNRRRERGTEMGGSPTAIAGDINGGEVRRWLGWIKHSTMTLPVPVASPETS
jgi:hypothetical protein